MQVAHKFKVRSLIYCSICGMQNIISIVFPDVILILVIKREQRKGKVVNYGSKVDLEHTTIRQLEVNKKESAISHNTRQPIKVTQG